MTIESLHAEAFVTLDPESKVIVAAGQGDVERSAGARGDLDGWLREAGTPGITGLDTRALVLHIRRQGAMRGALGSQACCRDLDHLAQLKQVC